MKYLKQSTAHTFRIGPFLDETDGKTAETGLTITQPDIRLSKNGGDFAQLAASGTLTHDEAGWYILTLATGDTNTVGSLIVAIHESGALPVWVEYQVVEEATYDFLYASGATPIADINAEVDTALAGYDGPTKAEMDTAHGLLATPAQVATELGTYDGPTKAEMDTGHGLLSTPADVATELGTYNGPTHTELIAEIDAVQSDIAALNDPDVAAIADAVWDELVAGHVGAGSFGKTDADILADTNELQGDWVNAGRLDTLLDAIKAVTDNLPNSGALSDLAAILTDTGTTLDVKINTIDTVVDAIKAITDLLPNAGALNDLATILADTNELQLDDIPGLIAALNDLSAAAVNAEVDTALTDIGLDHLVSAAVVGADVVDNSIMAKLVSSQATADWDDFVNTTDALQAIRDRGDAAWITGAGGSNPYVLSSTTIATLASQVSFTLTAGSADNGAYVGMLVIVEDASASTQKCIGVVSAYVGSTKTITLREDPGVFTMAAGDTIDVVVASPDLLNILADTNELQTDDIPAAISAVQSDTDDIQARIPATLVGGRIDADVGAKTGNVALSAQEKLDVNVEADTALTGYDGPTGAELVSEIDAVQADIAALNDPDAAAIADQVWDEAKSGHVAAGSMGEEVQAHALTSEVAAVETDTQDIQARLPTSLTNGSIDANVERWRDSVPGILVIGNVPGIMMSMSQAVLDSFSDAIWDELRSGHVTAGSFGQATQAGLIRNGTAQAGAGTTITLDASASATDDIFNDMMVVIVSGTGVGQARLITDYVGSTKVATISPAWQTTPGATSVFVVIAAGEVSGASAPSAATVADAVWDEAKGDHIAAASFGQILQAPVVRNGTAQAGTATTLTLDASASATDDIFNDMMAVIVGGTGIGQARLITDYVGSTKVATISPTWQTTPDATSVFVVLAAGEITGASAPSAISIADAVFTRDMDQIEDSAPIHSLCVAVLKSVSRIRDNLGVLQVYQTDGLTIILQQELTVDATAQPISEVAVGTP